MTSSTLFADCIDTSALDPSKHVNFVQGMVLGVDDFRQEFAWNAGRQRTLARELAGYGTVSGLKIDIADQRTTAAQIGVEPGLALTPSGELARITRRQCASVADFLARPENHTRAPSLRGSPSELGVWLHVRLRYADCLLDPVPIPGEPCRTEDEAMAASRIADSWKLHLGFDPPLQHEEDALRELVHWLKRIPLVEHAAATPADLARELRTAAAALLATSDRPGDLMLPDPPADFFIARADLCECLRAALLVWSTELRPRVQERASHGEAGCGCTNDSSGSPPASATPESDVSLASLWVPVREIASGIELDPRFDIELHEERRPYVLHLRMLQELVTCGPDATGALALATFASVVARSNEALLVWLHHPQELDLLDTGAVSVAVNDQDVSEFTLIPVPFASNVFELRFDGSLPVLLLPGDRVAVSFALNRVRERATGRTLRLALDETYGGYLDRGAEVIVAYTLVGPLALDDLVDVDGAGAADGLVLTSRGGRWSPEPVPRDLDDLGDVDTDLVSGGDGLVLTLRDQRWSPESVPRSLDDLADVDAESGSNGEVLTLHDGRWRPEPVQFPPHTHALDDLSDVDATAPTAGAVLAFNDAIHRWQAAALKLDDLADVNAPTPQAGNVLTRRGNVWVPEAPAPPPPPDAPVHSGRIRITKVLPGDGRWYGPFKHGFGDRLVMLRLALDVEESFEVGENTDTAWPTSAPRVVVGITPGADAFFVLLDDARKSGAEVNYVLRWFAIPVTEQLPDVTGHPIDLGKLTDPAIRRKVASGVIHAEVAAGNTRVDVVAPRVGMSTGQLKELLKDLAIKVTGNNIVLGNG
jgi:hypothetical protein